jgi:hypothetical protein
VGEVIPIGAEVAHVSADDRVAGGFFCSLG